MTEGGRADIGLRSGPPSGSAHDRALQALARRGRLRRLAPRVGHDFASNDFLGLASSSELREAAAEAMARGVPIGAGGSRLLRGNHEEHEALEDEAARFFGAESALYFGGGFTANAALFGTLPMRGDLVVYDALVHASAIEGMALGKAETVAVPHNDATAFEVAITRWRAAGGLGRPWIAVESIYSMDGDLAPLADLATIAARHDAFMLIDEAHATGIAGPEGRGLAAPFEGRDTIVCLHTCGKALGASGALVTCSRPMRDFLVNRARPFIYATAPSPVMAAVVRRALALVEREAWRRDGLASRVGLLGRRLAECGLAGSGTHIQPVIVGSDTRALQLAGRMQEMGYDVRAIRPPTVPEGTARLRLSVTLNVAEATIGAMVDALADALGPDGANEHRTLRSASTASVRRSVGGPGHKPLSAHAGPPADDRGRSVFVTGTGTGVGKTVFAAGLVAFLDGDYWKPIQTGGDEASDTDTVRVLSGLPADRFHREVYRLAAPMAPYLAAVAEGLAIDPPLLVPPTSARPLVIEGAGGLLVPLTANIDMADLVASWRIPAILVARTELGTINHTLLSVEAMRRRRVDVLGIAFIGAENEGTERFIVERSGVPRLGRLEVLPKLDATGLRAAFASGFAVETNAALASLLPTGVARRGAL